MRDTYDTTKKTSVCPIWWDPQNPARLSVVPSSHRIAAGVEIIREYSLFSASGAACNEHEFTALMKLLTAHEEHFSDAKQSSREFANLAETYRSAVKVCSDEWCDSINLADGDGSKSNTKSELFNYAAMRRVYSMMHISNIYLPLVSPMWEGENPYETPGYATADTVRFLRLHHMDPMDQVDPDIPVMIDSLAPQDFQGGLYWKFLKDLVLCGRLDFAWEILKIHSVYIYAIEVLEGDMGEEREIANDVLQGYDEIKGLFLRAPLPGGRTNEFDDGTNDEVAEDLEDQNYGMDGIDLAASDFKFWDSANLQSDAMNDYPVVFSPHSANYKHRRWQEHVKRVRQSARIVRRIPEIDGLLALLQGNFSNVTFSTWAEQFCAELIYQYPDLRPCDMNVQARRIMEDFDDVGSNEAILGIMEGEAGRAISHVYHLGASSGAALPSTLMALLYNLYMEMNVIPATNASRKYEFIIDAACSIQSSFADSKPDLAPQLAVRLLLPYAQFEGNKEVVAAIANILEHFSPSADQYGQTLISLCAPLVQKKSMLVLDGCCSVLKDMSRRHFKTGNAGRAIILLLDGIKLEQFVLPKISFGACYQIVARHCHLVCQQLLQTIIASIDEKTEENHTEVSPGVPIHLSARLMKEAFLQHEMDHECIQEALQLVRVVAIFDAFSRRENEEVADNIVKCLDKYNSEATGTLSCATPMPFHWPLLRIAKYIVDCSKLDSLFNVHGASLLGQRLVLLNKQHDEEVQEMIASFQNALAGAFVSENEKRGRLIKSNSTSCAVEESMAVRYSKLEQMTLSEQEDLVREMLDDF